MKTKKTYEAPVLHIVKIESQPMLIGASADGESLNWTNEEVSNDEELY